MKPQIDHLVIGATDLDQGIRAVEEWLGVTMPFGGVHEKMGTHNSLMKLGDSLFLEVIAIRSELTSPRRPRWFGLDDPNIRCRIATRPTLLAWVVNTDNISHLLNRANCSMGQARQITRGNIRWLFGLPDDGRLLAGGMVPYAIEWQTKPHPSNFMADLGCSLHGLALYHNHPKWLQSILKSIGAAGLVTIHSLQHDEAPYLEATINTVRGPRIISGKMFSI